MMNYYQLTHGLEEVNSEEEEVEESEVESSQKTHPKKEEQEEFRRDVGSKSRGGEGGGGGEGQQGLAGLELALGGSLAQDTITDFMRERQRNCVRGGGDGKRDGEGADQRAGRGGVGGGGGGGGGGLSGVVMRKKPGSGHPGGGGSIGRRASQRFSRILEGCHQYQSTFEDIRRSS